MASQAYQLVMRSGPNPGKTFDLTKSEMSIGRDIANDIIINDAEVSRRHARLIAQSGGYVLEDNGSTNGTFVNGQRLMGPHLLRPGELILLGENVGLAFEAQEPEVDATVAAAYNVPSAPPGVAPEASPRPAARESFPAAPAPVEAYVPPPPARPAAQEREAYVPPPPQANYSGNVPPGPVEVYPSPVEERRGFNFNWMVAGCLLVLLLLCVALVAFLFWVDSGGTARWCQYFGFLFGTACP